MVRAQERDGMRRNKFFFRRYLAPPEVIEDCCGETKKRLVAEAIGASISNDSHPSPSSSSSAPSSSSSSVADGIAGIGGLGLNGKILATVEESLKVKFS